MLKFLKEGSRVGILELSPWCGIAFFQTLYDLDRVWPLHPTKIHLLRLTHIVTDSSVLSCFSTEIEISSRGLFRLKRGKKAKLFFT
jgi:hypothetical protein